MTTGAQQPRGLVLVVVDAVINDWWIVISDSDTQICSMLVFIKVYKIPLRTHQYDTPYDYYDYYDRMIEEPTKYSPR